ncbi:MAG: hypothetical protein IT292_07655 [Deltaproteobacteria bacterium]|nr:hypothetical protein [Deltaproteobacteria bacterium]
MKRLGIFQIVFVFVLLLLDYGNLCLAATKKAKDTGHVIRSITVEVRDVFDEPDLGVFYRTANNLKVTTREKVIRRELIFRVGDVYDPFVIAESVRHLRALSSIRDVKIKTTFEGQNVDIHVSVQDTWTLFPQITYSLGGGSDKQSIGIVDSNFLGEVKRVEFFYAQEENREKIQGVYEDDLLFGTKNKLLLGQFFRSDGYRSVASLGKPFRSLVEDYAWITNAESYDLVDKLHKNGDERYIFRHNHLDFNGGYTYSEGSPEKQLRRYTFGYDYMNDKFKEPSMNDYSDVEVDYDSVSHDPNMLPDERIFSGPFFSYRNIEPEFISLNHIDKFERIQDFNLGLEYFAKIGYAPELLGSRDSTMFLASSISHGYRLDTASFFRNSFSASSRVNTDNVTNVIIGVEMKYYNYLGDRCFFGYPFGKHTIAGNFQAYFTDNLDKDKEYLLGAFSGLRGYKDRTFSGQNYMLLNLEDRIFYVEDVLKLFSVGSAFFLDVGGTSNNGLGSIIENNLYGDIGFGLRIAFPRAAGSTVWRFDIAYPLRDGPDGSSQFKPRFLITIGQMFNGNLSTEAPEAKQAKVDVGF